MKLALLFAVSIASTASVGFAGTVASPYQIGTWQGFRTAAVSYTFDGNLGKQYSVAVPMFNAKGFKLSLCTVTGWVSSWSSIQSAAASGHEIASLTVDHTSFGGMSAANQTAECKNSQSAINSHVTNQKCVSLAYPNGVRGSDSITSQYYIGARSCSGQINSSTPDFMFIGSHVCGSAGATKTATDFNNVANNAANSGGWCVFTIHALDNESGYSPLASSVLQSSVDYMNSNRSKFWVQTFGNVVRYIRERNAASVSQVASTATSLTVRVTDGLSNSTYNFPITIRRPLPSGWSSASASQSGKDLGAQIVTVNGVQNVMFDVVPDTGDVSILKK